MKNLSYLLVVLLVMVAVSNVAQAKNKYNKDYFGETIIHDAIFEDTLIHLARYNGLGFVELRAANPTLDAWIPGAGAKIILPKQHILPDAPRNGLVINLAEMRVYYFKEQGKAPQTYAISVGREGLETPTGSTKIVRKKDGPTWRPTKRMRDEDPNLPVSVGPGPDNPLGTHALYLGWPQYLMHGTNKPYGIGRRVSSGCMRMYPEDIKRLFPQVPVGTPVTVVDQPIKVGWIKDGLYVEVSPSQKQSLEIEEDATVTPYKLTPEDLKRINRKAGVHKDKIDWTRLNDVVANYSGYPIEVMNTTGRPLTPAAGPQKKEEYNNEVEIRADNVKVQSSIYDQVDVTSTQGVANQSEEVRVFTGTGGNFNN